MDIKLKRVDDAFHMEAVGVSGVPVQIDASEAVGGKNLGSRPMELLIMGLAGCMSIDVILILKKQKQEIKDYEVVVSGDRETIEGTQMTPFRKINLHFIIQGKVDEKKLDRAIKLSQEKYCSATAQFNNSAEITHTYEVTA
jgi:putative redox protein